MDPGETFARLHAVKELWWQKYRKRQYKRQRLTLEMVVRKSAWETTMEYVDQCSIAGVKQMRDPDIGIIQRLLWIAFFTIMCASLFIVLIHTWVQAITSPLIVTLESSTYPISDIDFPAVAVCNINRISKKALGDLAKEIYKHLHTTRKIHSLGKRNITLQYVYEYLKQLGFLFDFWWDENLKVYQHIDELLGPANDTRQLVDLMKKLAPSCDDVLMRCAWGSVLYDCEDIFSVRRTTRGHCCVFNYVSAYDSANSPHHTIDTVKRQNISGDLKGLHFLLDPMIDDYAYTVNPTPGFEIFLFDPTHFADPNAGGRVIRRIVQPDSRVLIELQSIKQLAAKEVRKYPQKTRKCLFHDEIKDIFHNLYSYSACLIRCKIKTISTLCKCIPFFLPTSEQDLTICTLNELRCLNKYKEKLLHLYPIDALRTDGLEVELQDSLWCPECLPDCEFTQHITKAYTRPITMASSELQEFKGKEVELNFINNTMSERTFTVHTGHSQDVDLTDKIFISIYQSTSDGILNRLDVVSYWYEILSNIGGYAGILLGLCISSVVEFLYFLLYRFPRLLYYNLKMYH